MKLISVKHQEHQRIGRDLHDAKVHELHRIEQSLRDKGQHATAEELKMIKENIRLLSHELQQLSFSEEEFDDQVLSLLYSLNKTGVKVRHDGLKSIDWQNISDIVKQNLYLVISEATMNIKNHSEATEAVFTFSKEKKNIALTIEDNGKGVDRESYSGGIGLQNMQFRIHEVNGNFKFHSTRGKGTEISIFISL